MHRERGLEKPVSAGKSEKTRKSQKKSGKSEIDWDKYEKARKDIKTEDGNFKRQILEAA